MRQLFNRPKLLFLPRRRMSVRGEHDGDEHGNERKDYIYPLLPFLLLTSGRSSVIIVSLRTRRDVRVVYGAGLENQ